MSDVKRCSLMQKTLDLLEADKRTIPEVSEETGLPYYWLRQFATGKIPDPSVNRVQELYEALSGKSLVI